MTPSHIKKLLYEITANDCERSLKSLFFGLYPSLTGFANSILKSQEDAEESVTDFFMGLWQKRKELPEMENPRLYFLVGVKNASINRLKKRDRQELPPLDEWQTNMESVFFNPEELLLSSEAVRRIMNGVNTLPPKCKLIFKLVKEDGLKYQEVADLLNLSLKTVESQMAIAFRRIRSTIEIKNSFILHN